MSEKLEIIKTARATQVETSPHTIVENEVYLNKQLNRVVDLLDDVEGNESQLTEEVATIKKDLGDLGDQLVEEVNKLEGEINAKQATIIDSEEVVVDTDTNKLYLAQAVSNKVYNSLQLPQQAPTANVFVGVAPNGAQVNIGYSEDFTTTPANNFELSKHVYKHNFTIYYEDSDFKYTFTASFINDSNANVIDTRQGIVARLHNFLDKTKNAYFLYERFDKEEVFNDYGLAVLSFNDSDQRAVFFGNAGTLSASYSFVKLWDSEQATTRPLTITETITKLI